MTIGLLEDWLTAYGLAWMHRDAEAAAKLFTKDAWYFESPFGPPAQGKSEIIEYWNAATRNQSEISFAWQIVSLTGNVGVVHWQAGFERTSSNARVQLDGVFVLDFDENGLCKILREWWHRKES
jgi:ketosteroid isomerase-like protein